MHGNYLQVSNRRSPQQNPHVYTNTLTHTDTYTYKHSGKHTHKHIHITHTCCFPCPDLFQTCSCSCQICYRHGAGVILRDEKKRACIQSCRQVMNKGIKAAAIGFSTLHFIVSKLRVNHIISFYTHCLNAAVKLYRMDVLATFS